MSGVGKLTRRHGVTEGRACRTPHSASFAARTAHSGPFGAAFGRWILARGIPATAVPRLRFKGFKGEWEKAKLADVITIRRGLTYRPSDVVKKGGVRVLRSSNIAEDTFVYGDDDVFVKPEAVNIPFAENGEILITAANGSLNLVGKHAVVKNMGEKTAVPGGFMMAGTTRNPQFANAWLSADWFRDFSRLYVGGGNGTIGNLNKTGFDCYAAPMPSDVGECDFIASFFSRLDAAIAAAKARVGKLRRVKKAMLVKMFPREGASVPEIRFKGFEGEWENDLATNIFETTNERNHPELRVVSANQEKGMIFRDEGGMQIAHNKENEKTYKRVCPGNFVIHLRSFQGGFAHSVVEGITSPAYTIMKFRDSASHCDWFWRYVLTSKPFIKRLETITYGIRDGRSISFEEFGTLQMIFPSVAEERKIGAFFSNLDKLISAAEKRVGKLKQVKAALLEGMFA